MDELVEILRRQTTYTKEEALLLLTENKGDIEKCISIYLGIKPKPEPEISTNQKIFKSIREFI
uniref:UBA domain-containing protein n=1 Tax=viral metagenome TaxID=1070528 RepID=A0A6C0EXX4_9ZZZZ